LNTCLIFDATDRKQEALIVAAPVGELVVVVHEPVVGVVAIELARTPPAAVEADWESVLRIDPNNSNAREILVIVISEIIREAIEK